MREAAGPLCAISPSLGTGALAMLLNYLFTTVTVAYTTSSYGGAARRPEPASSVHLLAQRGPDEAAERPPQGVGILASPLPPGSTLLDRMTPCIPIPHHGSVNPLTFSSKNRSIILPESMQQCRTPVGGHTIHFCKTNRVTLHDIGNFLTIISRIRSNSGKQFWYA